MPNKKKKGFRCSPLGSAGSKSIHKPQRPQRRKQWTVEQMDVALYSVTYDGLSGNKAADLHGVPRSTLKDRLSGRVKHGTKPGPKLYLSNAVAQRPLLLLLDGHSSHIEPFSLQKVNLLSPTPHHTWMPTPQCWSVRTAKATLGASMPLILSKEHHPSHIEVQFLSSVQRCLA